MSRLSEDYLQSWMKAFISDADKGGGSLRAAVLAGQCREDAALLGISVDDEPERGNVESIIYARMQMPKEEELAFWKVWGTMTKKILPKH